MIFEVITCATALGIAGVAKYKNSSEGASNDREKIQRIFANCGLYAKDKGEMKTIRYKRKNPLTNPDGKREGMEYIFQLPLGMSFQQIKDKENYIVDGLNIRSFAPQFRISDFKSLKGCKSLDEIKAVINKRQLVEKSVELSFDGMLRIKVYETSLPKKITFDESWLKPNSYKVPIGMSRKGLIYHDFDKRPHMIVGGSTGFGKSVALKLFITCLTLQNPDHAKFHLIDLKGGSAFNRFKQLKQVGEYATDPDSAITSLEAIQKQMNDKIHLIAREGFEDVKEKKDKERHFIIIDESADIADKDKAMKIVTDIARRGRGAGFYLVYATQYPTIQVCPSQVKRNVSPRLCFTIEGGATASNVILDSDDATQLPPIEGRAVYKGLKNEFIQVPFISNTTINELLEPYKEEKHHEQNPTERKESGRNTFEFKEL